MTLPYVTASEVLGEFERNVFQRPTKYETVGMLFRHGKSFYRSGDVIKDENDEVWTLEGLVEWINESVRWRNGERKAHYVQSDVQEHLKHPLTGEYIDSKSKFRQRTREYGGVEIGNESISKHVAKVQAEKDAARRASLRETIKKNIQRGL